MSVFAYLFACLCEERGHIHSKETLRNLASGQKPVSDFPGLTIRFTQALPGRPDGEKLPSPRTWHTAMLGKEAQPRGQTPVAYRALTHIYIPSQTISIRRPLHQGL